MLKGRREEGDGHDCGDLCFVPNAPLFMDSPRSCANAPAPNWHDRRRRAHLVDSPCESEVPDMAALDLVEVLVV
eukprot:6054207-Lingulodinium_polyedra.AAC.1